MAVASDWVPLSGVWRRDNRDAIEAERTIVLQSRLAELVQARVDGAHAHLGAPQAGEAKNGRQGLASAGMRGGQHALRSTKKFPSPCAPTAPSSSTPPVSPPALNGPGQFL